MDNRLAKTLCEKEEAIDERRKSGSTAGIRVHKWNS